MKRTTTISRKVNPSPFKLLKVPVLDVLILPLSTRLPIRSIGDQVILPVSPRTEIDKGVCPGVLRHLGNITVFTPFRWNRTDGGLGDQGLQALLGGRIKPIVQTKEVERPLQLLYLDLGSGFPGLIGAT